MIKILFSIFLLILCSCGLPRFAKDGIIVYDVDEYFNPKQDINVWVYSNFYPYKGLDQGVRLKNWYPQDKAVLKQIGLKGRNSKVLFSALPESDPYYHLIAIQHMKRNHQLQGFSKVEVDSSYYFQKDYKLDRLDIRHVYIPYEDDRALSLIYYISTEQHYNCPFCKLDYLARVNAKELQHKKGYIQHWQIFNCDESKKIATIINLDPAVLNKNKRTYLKIYADYETSRGIQYFQILNQKSNSKMKLELCPERYTVELLDAKEQLLRSDSLLVQ